MARVFTSLAVYCGSNFGTSEAYRHAAAALGTEMARRGIALVYGGTHKGLMGVLADSVIAGGGRVHGIITRRLFDKGHLHQALSQHEIVDNMKLRKAAMLEVADGCIALPGGIGTAEEFLEAWTLNQLSEIDKPVGLLDVAGFYQPFLAFVDTMVAQGFLPAAHRDGLAVAADPAKLIDALQASPPITVPKWMS